MKAQQKAFREENGLMIGVSISRCAQAEASRETSNLGFGEREQQCTWDGWCRDELSPAQAPAPAQPVGQRPMGSAANLGNPLKGTATILPMTS